MSISEVQREDICAYLCSSCGLEINGQVFSHVCTALFHKQCLQPFMKTCPQCNEGVHFEASRENVDLSLPLDRLSRIRFNGAITHEKGLEFLLHSQRVVSERFDISGLLQQVMQDLCGEENVDVTAKRHAAFVDLLFMERVRNQVDVANGYYIPNEREIRESIRGFFAQFRFFFLWLLKNGDGRMRSYIPVFKSCLMHSPNAIRSLAYFQKIFVEKMTNIYFTIPQQNRALFLEGRSDDDLQILMKDNYMHDPARYALLNKKELRYKSGLKMVLLSLFIFMFGAILAYSKIKDIRLRFQ